MDTVVGDSTPIHEERINTNIVPVADKVILETVLSFEGQTPGEEVANQEFCLANMNWQLTIFKAHASTRFTIQLESLEGASVSPASYEFGVSNSGEFKFPYSLRYNILAGTVKVRGIVDLYPNNANVNFEITHDSTGALQIEI